MSQELETKLELYKKALDTLIPIVDVAFYDHHSAGNMPGSGYHHKVYNMISSKFGWAACDKWEKFKKELGLK